MRSTILILVLAIATARGAEPGFWQQLTPDERARAGIDALTPAQRAALDELAARFSGGDSRAMAEKPATAATAPAAVRPENPPAQPQPSVAPESGVESRIGLPPKSEDGEKVNSRIAGEFRGWTGATIFRLENGQVWVQEDPNDHQWFKVEMNPSVEISHSMFGGWKLTVEGRRGMWVRVRRVQ